MTKTNVIKTEHEFISRYIHRSFGVLRWPQLDILWETVKKEGQWYIYPIGSDTPEATATAKELADFIRTTDQFLHDVHEEDYCGVVYTDNFEAPSLLKIYHPKKMGAGCGSSGHTILPLWTLSTIPPSDLLDWAVEKEDKPSWWKLMMKTG